MFATLLTALRKQLCSWVQYKRKKGMWIVDGINKCTAKAKVQDGESWTSAFEFYVLWLE